MVDNVADRPYTQGLTLRDIAEGCHVSDDVATKLAQDLIEAQHHIETLLVAIENAAEWHKVVETIAALERLAQRNRGAQ